jgi:hypothetical protein
MDICSSFEEKLYDLEMGVPRREMQWGIEVPLLSVDVSAVVKQQLHNVAMSKSGCNQQRGPAKFVSAIHICAVFDQ